MGHAGRNDISACIGKSREIMDTGRILLRNNFEPNLTPAAIQLRLMTKRMKMGWINFTKQWSPIRCLMMVSQSGVRRSPACHGVSSFTIMWFSNGSRGMRPCHRHRMSGKTAGIISGPIFLTESSNRIDRYDCQVVTTKWRIIHEYVSVPICRLH